MKSILKNNWRQEDAAVKKSLRDGFGRAVLELAEANSKIVVLTGDLSTSLRLDGFQKRHSHRFFQIGVAEQNLVGVAVGMAIRGSRPIIGSFGTFLTGRAWELIRVQVCINNLPIILVGSHTGLSHPLDGATAQATEDIALMQVLPNMTVIAPGDASQVKFCLLEAIKLNKPVYLRLAREPTTIFCQDSSRFVPAQTLIEGKEITIAVFGLLTHEALQAAILLKKQNISAEVIQFLSLKPLDIKNVLLSLNKTGCLLTVEDHQLAGGFGSSMIQAISKIKPVLTDAVGLDGFGQTGKNYSKLLAHFNLDRYGIAKKAALLIEKKHKLQ